MKKVLMMLLALVLVACVSIGGTLAFLTSADTVTNTFTIGKVAITLDEAKVDANGEAIDPAERVQSNSYRLKAGKSYDKDPTVTVTAGSEDCYVRVFVTINNKEKLDKIFADYEGDKDLTAIFGGYNGDIWKYHDVTREGDNIVYELRYHEKVTDPQKLDPVFKKLNIPDWFTGEDLQNLMKDDPDKGDFPLTITITAEAIQSEGFYKADDAFVALDDKYHPVPTV